MRVAVCLLVVCAGAAAAAAANDDWKKPDFCGQRDCPRFQLVGLCAEGLAVDACTAGLLPPAGRPLSCSSVQWLAGRQCWAAQPVQGVPVAAAAAAAATGAAAWQRFSSRLS